MKTLKDDSDRDTAKPVDKAEQKVGRPEDKPYSGVLAEPIVIDWAKDNFVDNFLVDYMEKVNALFDHFQVAQGNFPLLALELAHRHVPGFRLQKPAGAPERWSLSQQARLIHAVRRYQAGKRGSGASVSAACRHIAAAGSFEKASAGTLERRYYAAIKNDEFVRVAKNLKDSIDSGRITGHDELVALIMDMFLRE